jgi:hypothetical protein
MPGVFTIDEVQLPESHHLHEAAHVIAAQAFEGARFTSSQQRILRDIMCESFANSVDALACASAEDELHQLFLAPNCYMHPSGDEFTMMLHLRERLSLRNFFVLTFLSYVHSNFFREMTPAMIAKLIAKFTPGLKADDELLAEIGELAQIADLLDPQFRTSATSLYLRLEGHNGELMELLNFDFMKVFEEHPSFQKALDRLVAVIA